jgi:hypothetical protein
MDYTKPNLAKTFLQDDSHMRLHNKSFGEMLAKRPGEIIGKKSGKGKTSVKSNEAVRMLV